jgi:hypothetical protein
MCLVWYDLEEEKTVLFSFQKTGKVQSQKDRSNSQNKNTAVIKGGGLMMMYYRTSSVQLPQSEYQGSGARRRNESK